MVFLLMNAKINKIISDALTFFSEKRFDDAEQLCRKQLLDFPENAELLKLLGILHVKKGRFERALAFFQKALGQKPDSPDILNLSGAASAEVGEFEKAGEYYSKAISLKPDYAEAFYNLANLKFAMNDYIAAVDLYTESIRLNPDYFKAFVNRGNSFKKLNKFKDALDSYKEALRLEPDSYEAHINCGTALQGLLQFEEAAVEYQKAAELNPQSPDPYKNKGDIFKDLLNLDSAVEQYRKAISIKNDDADAHMFLGMALLLQGKFKEGWAEYEWRLRRSEFRRQNIKYPRWNGEPLTDKTLLVQAEQGFGDTVQFIRYLPILKKNCGKLFFVCRAPLIPLIEKLGFADLILPLGGDYQNLEIDFQIPLMSLPFAMKTVVGSIPVCQQYIKADSAKVQFWRERLKPIDGRKIGICWSGSPTNTNDFNRSMPFSHIEKLFVLPIEFFALQKLNKPIEAEYKNFHDFSDGFKDFSDTAAFMENMDLIISVDTVVAHLAGAMGQRTALLLPFVPEWRWMMNRVDSPWYPEKFKIYRQSARGDWAGVIERLKTELSR